MLLLRRARCHPPPSIISSRGSRCRGQPRGERRPAGGERRRRHCWRGRRPSSARRPPGRRGEQEGSARGREGCREAGPGAAGDPYMLYHLFPCVCSSGSGWTVVVGDTVWCGRGMSGAERLARALLGGARRSQESSVVHEGSEGCGEVGGGSAAAAGEPPPPQPPK